MITQALLGFLFGIVEMVIGLFPSTSYALYSAENYSVMSSVLSFALTWFPVDLWVTIISNIVFWLGLHGTWIVIEWVYKKIPGVN